MRDAVSLIRSVGFNGHAPIPYTRALRPQRGGDAQPQPHLLATVTLQRRSVTLTVGNRCQILQQVERAVTVNPRYLRARCCNQQLRSERT